MLENNYAEETILTYSMVPTEKKAITRTEKKVKIENKIQRGIDVVGGLVGVSMLFPITVGICVAKIVTKEKGPIFYSQERIGQGGNTFKMYKFRSMVVDADEKLDKYLEENEEAREEYKKNKKLKNDPRITKIGKFIRTTSLDEFPQFINVLKGEMCLVGPRPYLPREKEDMGDTYNQIIKCKPGITGLWQVNGRSNTTFEDRLKIEKYYSENNNLKMNTSIFFKTFKVTLFNKDAK